jgi:BCD family chlorophyll transporter-like MFS transporter
MNRAPREQAGLALGAWGAVQATAAGVGVALSGVIRDLVNAAVGATDGLWGLAGAASGYITVYVIEIALLLVAIAATIPLIRRASGSAGAAPRGEPGVDISSGPLAPRAAESAGGSQT